MRNFIKTIPNLNNVEKKNVYNVFSVLLVWIVFLFSNLSSVVAFIMPETTIKNIDEFKDITTQSHTELKDTTKNKDINLINTKLNSSYTLLNQKELNYHFNEYTTKVLPIRIKLDKFMKNTIEEYKNTTDIVVENTAGMYVFKNKERVGEFKSYTFKKEELSKNNYTLIAKSIFTPSRITSLNNIPKWANSDEAKAKYNDNMFRGILEFKLTNTNDYNSIEIINELDLEQYIKGIAEATGNSHEEKMKVMAIISRSYAYFYLKSDFEKFPGKDFHLDDNPQHSQKYVWYGIETRNEKWLKAVKETQGFVLFDNKDYPVIAPYSTCTLKNNEGELRRKSLEEAQWWNQYANNHAKFNTEVIKPIKDVRWGECQPTQVAGHGVGLSGNGAEAQAQEGKDFISILQYYYHNVNLKKVI